MFLEINPDYQFLKDFVCALPQTFKSQGTVLYKARNEVRLVEVNEVRIVIKMFKVPHLINRIAYSFFRKSKARRSYEYAEILEKKGISTPTPIAYIEINKQGLLCDSYYVCLECPYPRLMREFWTENLVGKEDIIKAFARFSAKVHEAGVYHIDYSPGNILFDKDEKGIRFSIIDINRMKFCEVDEELGYKNFERLWIKEEAYILLAKEYALARGYDPGHAVERVLYYKSKFMASRGHK